MKLSVVIPAYNEEQNVSETVNELLDASLKIAEIDDIEIIVVDDHSGDNTFTAVMSIDDARVKCLRLSKRSGSHTALRAGLDAAEGDAVLCISCDGQDDPAALGRMLEERRKGAKIVWALRESREGESFFVRASAVVFYRFLGLVVAGDKNSVDLSRADFYLLDRVVVEALKACREQRTSLFGLVNWVGFPAASVQYSRRKRRHGASKWNFCSRMNLAWDWVVSFSGVPLKFISWLGLCTAAAGFLYAVVVIVNSVFGDPVEGWSSLMCLILILGGGQMLILSVLGEYLWRCTDESRKRPLYFIEKKSD